MGVVLYQTLLDWALKYIFVPRLKGVFCKAFRALNSNAFNCSWHYYCTTKYQHLKYCPVTLKFPQLGIYGAIKSIGIIFCSHSQQVSRLHTARILVSFGTWRATVIPSLENSAKSHWRLTLSLFPRNLLALWRSHHFFHLLCTYSSTLLRKEKAGRTGFSPCKCVGLGGRGGEVNVFCF